jgi:AcrR family transcriptional regulator
VAVILTNVTTPGPVRGNYAKTAARRREIVEAGVEVFSTGYHSGSIREVAERVGISQAGLLHHFSSKSALLAAVLEQRDDRARAMVQISPVDGLETLRGLIELTEYNTTIPGMVQLYCVLSAESTATDHPAHDYFVNRYRYTVEVVEDAFQMIADAGQLAPAVDPATAARAIIALMDGLQVQWLLDRDSVDMGADVRAAMQRMVTVEI